MTTPTIASTPAPRDIELVEDQPGKVLARNEGGYTVKQVYQSIDLDVFTPEQRAELEKILWLLRWLARQK